MICALLIKAYTKWRLLNLCAIELMPNFVFLCSVATVLIKHFYTDQQNLFILLITVIIDNIMNFEESIVGEKKGAYLVLIYYARKK